MSGEEEERRAQTGRLTSVAQHARRLMERPNRKTQRQVNIHG
jgi:uncharacterized protein YciW